MNVAYSDKYQKNECVASFKRNVIHISLQSDNLTSNVVASIYKYSHEEDEFLLERTEKINTNKENNLLSQKLIGAVVLLNFQTGFKTLFVILFTHWKEIFGLQLIAYNDLHEKGSQLQSVHKFLIPCNVTDTARCFFMLDGPSVSYQMDGKLHVICCPLSTSRVFTYPLNINGFVHLKRCKNKYVLSTICGLNGNLTSWSFEDYKQILSVPLIPPQFVANSSFQAMNVKFSWKCPLDTVIYVMSNCHLYKFQNGKMEKNISIERAIHVCNIFFFERFNPTTSYIVLLSSIGQVLVVNAKSFEIERTWENIEFVQISDALVCGNNVLFFKRSTSDSNNFIQQLRQNFFATDVANILYPNSTDTDSTSRAPQQKNVTAKILQKKLKMGLSAQQNTESKIEEKLEFIKKVISDIQSTSATGTVNYTFLCSSTVDVFPYCEESKHLFKKTKFPLKVIKLEDKFHKDFWSINLRVQNQSFRVLKNFTVQLIALHKPIEYHVKFLLESKDLKIGTTNLSENTNYFSSSSPSIQLGEILTIIVIVPFSQVLFEYLDVNFHISVLFHDLKENVLRLQFCGCLSFNDTSERLVDRLSTDGNDMWPIRPTYFRIRLKLLTCHSSSDILSWTTSNHRLYDVWLQLRKTNRESAIDIDVNYNCDSQVILLIQLMYKHLPSDFVVTTNIGDVEKLLMLFFHSIQKELNISHDILSSQSNYSTLQRPKRVNTTNVQDSLQRIRSQFVERQMKLQESRHGEIEVDIFTPLQQKLIKVELETEIYIALLSTNSIPYVRI